MKHGWFWILGAWAFALVSTLGALFIGEVMGMTPCLLCWYQRIFMFPLAIILGIAAFAEDRRGAIYAMPLALGGAAVAGYHTALIAGWVPKWWVPCGTGPSCSEQSLEILGGIQIPWLSLLAFIAIAFLLLVYLRVPFMNTKKFTVIGLVAIVALFFYLGMNAYQSRVQTAQDVQVKAEQTRLVRMHSPVFGPQNAPVTIVEFFDPACETCRAFYPIVKNLMAQYPEDVRLVIRYAPFHQGSDVVVKLLESFNDTVRTDRRLEVARSARASEGSQVVTKTSRCVHTEPHLFCQKSYEFAAGTGAEMQTIWH